jgi:hypothetical protein
LNAAAREHDKRIVEAAHTYLTTVQEITKDTDRKRLVVGAIGALLVVAIQFGCKPIDIFLDIRKRLGL